MLLLPQAGHFSFGPFSFSARDILASITSPQSLQMYP
jgi:hypothetical protein